jgi:protein-tyrosine kinase
MSIIERAMQRDAASKRASTPGQGSGSTSEDAVASHVVAGDAEGVLTPDGVVTNRDNTREQVLNLALMRRQGLLIPDDGRSVLAEEFRILKRPVLANAFGESGERIGRRNVVMVTSAVPREGKTYTAINLAMSVATELERTVLLIDADVVQPSIPARLGLSVGKGLIDLLEHPEADLSEFLVRTNIPNLTLMGAGRKHGRSTELLASAAMAKLVNDLATRYSDRLVLFDSPPMLATSESSVLARHMGQVILTVQAGSTPRSAVSRVVRMLDSCEIVVPVLNRATGIPGMNYAMGYYLDGQYGKQ